MRRILYTLLALACLTTACQEGGPRIEEGVSHTLAASRKAAVSTVCYDLHFDIPASREEPVEGSVGVTFVLAERVPLQLDFLGDRVDSVEINGKAVPVRWEKEHIVLPRKHLSTGTNRVRVVFTAADQSLNRNPDYLYTLLVPDRARTVFPCFDQPDLKAVFRLSLSLPSSCEAVSCGAVESETVDGDRKHLVFKETEPISTYLFAFAEGKWSKVTDPESGMTMYHRETDPAKLSETPEIFRLVREARAWMEEYTGIPMPFSKYDFVVVPGFQFGGMEHPGAVFYNDKRIFLSEKPSQGSLLSRMNLIGHETSHLWFGDAVTMQWFDDVWTKEVFANYFAAEMTGPLFPGTNTAASDFRSFRIDAYKEDRTAGSTPIKQRLDNLCDAGLVYGNIIYYKAPAVMQMLSALSGPEAFRSGIREYLRTYLYGNADWSDLVNILDRHTPGTDLKAWSRSWVEEAGMPDVQARWEDGKIAVTQQDPAGKGRCWPQTVDLFLDGTPVSVFLEGERAEIPCPERPGTVLPAASLYGCFLPDSASLRFALGHPGFLPAPQDRLCQLATLYENLLRGRVDPGDFARSTVSLIREEKERQVVSAAFAYLGTLLIHGSSAGDARLEEALVSLMQDPALGEGRKSAFNVLQRGYRLPSTADLMYGIWESGQAPEGLNLSERDFMTLALQLAVRLPDRFDTLRTVQEGRIRNPDRKREFNFVVRAVDPSLDKRNELMQSLLDPENRRMEPWVATVLQYLNHPLRQAEALPYITPALEEMEEVKRTGDIFFPKNWISAVLSGHDSPEAADAVEAFLAARPDCHPMLRNKILQAAHHLTLARKNDGRY